MDTNFKASLKLVLAHEGGYVNNPADPGGETNKGVTKAVYDTYRKRKGLPVRSVKLISAAEVEDIYRAQYWDLAGCDDMPLGLDYAVFDYAVNSGVSRAAKDLQRVLGTAIDGIIGQSTLQAARAACVADIEGTIAAYCERRLRFMKSLKTWKTFGKGWQRRVMGARDGFQATDTGVIDYAIMMSRQARPVAVAKLAAIKPVPVGTRTGEVPGKASEGDQAVTRTPEGLGTAVAGAGGVGTAVVSGVSELGGNAMDASRTAGAYIDETLIGRIALIAFLVLILAGVGLTAWSWHKRIRERAE